MRRMNEADVREWVPGEPVERVDFGGRKTGLDKKCPSDMSDGGLKKLLWRCAVAKADSGLDCQVDYAECSWTKRPMFSVTAGRITAFAFSFDGAWTYINGLENGYALAGRGNANGTGTPSHHRHGLYETLRMVLNGISGSSSHRHANSTRSGPLVKYSMVSPGSNESGMDVHSRNTPPDSAVTDSTCTRRAPLDAHTPKASPDPFGIRERGLGEFGALHVGLLLEAFRLALQNGHLIVEPLQTLPLGFHLRLEPLGLLFSRVPTADGGDDPADDRYRRRDGIAHPERPIHANTSFPAPAADSF